MSGDGTYAPKSPDLSSFFAAPAPATAHPPPTSSYTPQYPQAGQHYRPQSPQQFSPNQTLDPQQSYFQASPQYSQPPYLQVPQHQQLQQQLPQSPRQQQQLQPPLPVQAYYNQQPPPPPSQFYQPYGSPQYQNYGPQGYQPSSSAFSPSVYQSPQQIPPQRSPVSPAAKTESSPAMPPRKAAAAAAAAAALDGGASAAALADGRIVLPSPVKTKFPTARIKRIMQADEEVGKVSQQTPIAVGKALELFMIALVSKSADVARIKNSKRVTAQMLKQVVESDDQWDFLRDIVKKIGSDEKHARGPSRSSTGGGEGGEGGGGTKTKLESDSDNEQPKKRGRPARKKKA